MLLRVATEALDVLITVLLADNKRATTHWLTKYMNKSTTNIPQH